MTSDIFVVIIFEYMSESSCNKISEVLTHTPRIYNSLNIYSVLYRYVTINHYDHLNDL